MVDRSVVIFPHESFSGRLEAGGQLDQAAEAKGEGKKRKKGITFAGGRAVFAKFHGIFVFPQQENPVYVLA